MAGRKSEKVTVEGCSDAPAIDGCNFFSGEYMDDDQGGASIAGGLRQEDWEFFWCRHARKSPPGPLPEGALAILRFDHSPGDPTVLEPESVKLDNDVAHVSWKHIHTILPGEPEERSRYAILIVPGKELKEVFNPLFLAEELKVLTEGSRETIRVLPVTRFRPKM
jgi:hypothetical protein